VFDIDPQPAGELPESFAGVHGDAAYAALERRARIGFAQIAIRTRATGLG